MLTTKNHVSSKKVKVGNDQETGESEIPTPKTEMGENKLTFRYS